MSDAHAAAAAGGLPSHGRLPQAVLFDLDGTLVDSAPDLAGAANDLRVARGLDPLPYARLRPLVGTGARGMVGAAFGLAPGEAGFDALKDAFLARYAQRLLRATRPFDGVGALLDRLEQVGLRWGIVTNKHLCYATPVCEGLGLWPRAAVLVGGDSTPRPKPHPDPLLEAARRLALPADACIYVGDDERDIVAARAAGMPALAAGWGYLGDGPRPADWGADAVLDAPAALTHWLDLA
ncbi:phosphoglycolate phosphatase [Pseudaquabacterium rugosum]|uniref:phosphoglycolate phosphatase n=1 Tax=Pseudaquabacterium rugosum TaxID=2984194 RepID=A0ABU9B9K5_9BURK